MASHTDFGFLRGLFEGSPKIMPSNLDMVYGINDKFLLGEWKRDNEEISEDNLNIVCEYIIQMLKCS